MSNYFLFFVLVGQKQIAGMSYEAHDRPRNSTQTIPNDQAKESRQEPSIQIHSTKAQHARLQEPANHQREPQCIHGPSPRSQESCGMKLEPGEPNPTERDHEDK